MSDKINHNGMVEEVIGEHVKVRILQTSACAACKVAGHCSAAESKEKIVDVKVEKGGGYKVGDSVVVSTTQTAVGKAMLVGFVLPFVVMVSSLLVTYSLLADELLSALAALFSLFPYYLIIYVMGERITRNVTFNIEPRNY
ncbi:MAG: SoxR reducing system RseC family protein [Prevotella sp.]